MNENTTSKVVIPSRIKRHPNPTGKGGFGDNPHHRSTGHWKKEDTPRYKLEQMMKMSAQELQDIILTENIPLFEEKLATAIIESDWKTIREMIAEVYGNPKTSVDVTSDGKQLKTVVEIIDARSTYTNTD